MESALSWVGEIAHFIISLCPHLVIIKTTDQGLKWVNGSKEVLLTSENGCRTLLPRVSSSWPFLHRPATGLHWYLPVVTELTVIPVRRQTLNLDDQFLTTRDGKAVGVGGILVYSVRNTQVLLTACEDYEVSMKDICLTVVKRVVTGKEFQWFIDNPVDADRLLTKTIRAELNPFGVKTIRLTLGDFCSLRPIGLWGGSSPV